MATKEEYQKLLDEVKDEKSKSLNKGDLFNIFEIIGKSSDEVNIHSKFLAMLLNTKGEFNSEIDFLKQYTENNDYGNERMCKIEKIPYSYLRHVLKSVYHEERTGNYIGNGLGESWKYKTIRYNNNTCKGFERQSCNRDLFL